MKNFQLKIYCGCFWDFKAAQLLFSEFVPCFYNYICKSTKAKSFIYYEDTVRKNTASGIRTCALRTKKCKHHNFIYGNFSIRSVGAFAESDFVSVF